MLYCCVFLWYCYFQLDDVPLRSGALCVRCSHLQADFCCTQKVLAPHVCLEDDMKSHRKIPDKILHQRAKMHEE